MANTAIAATAPRSPATCQPVNPDSLKAAPPVENRAAANRTRRRAPGALTPPCRWHAPRPGRSLDGERSLQEPAMYARSLTLALGALLLLEGCGSASRGTRGPGAPAPVRSSDAVTMEELAKVSSSSTLFEALRALRPIWFRRNPTTLRPEAEGDVVVYLDQSRLGGPESLRPIPVTGVTPLRLYSAAVAEARLCPQHPHGSLRVITTR